MTIHYEVFPITVSVLTAVVLCVLVISVGLTNVEYAKFKQMCIDKAIEAKMTGDDIQKICGR